MSLEDFQLIDNESVDNSIIKRDFIRIYHQQGAQLNDPDQNIESIFGDNNNYHQIGNSYLQFDILVRPQRAADAFADDSPIRLVNNAFAHCFKEGVINTTGGMEIENIKFLGQVSTIMKSSTSKDGDLLSQFDNINEGETEDDIRSASLHKMWINIHIEANRGKIKGQLPLEDIFGFCKTFKKITKNLGFHITLKTNNLQNIIYTTIADVTQINVTINSLFLFVPRITPNSETQVMFNESIKNNYTLTFDSWYTEQKIVTNGGEFQVDIASSQSTNSPKNLIAAHQTEARVGTSNKRNNFSIFDHVDVSKYFVEIDGYRYPKESIISNFSENDCLDQYRGLKSFYQEYVGEELMNPFISYTDMKKKYPIQVIDLRHQIDHISPEKIQLFEEYKNDPVYENKRLYVILNRHKQIEMISDGNKFIEIRIK